MQYSFHGIADLGSKRGCQSLDNTDYVVVSLNVSTTPVFIRQGLCMPASCHESQYLHFGSQVSSVLTHALQSLIKTKNIDIYIVPPDVGVEVSFINTNERSSQSLFDASAGNQSQTGIYGPSFSTVGLGLVLTTFILLIGGVITASILTSKSRRNH